MRLLEPLADPGAPLARRNPTAKLAASALLTFILLASVDPVTPAIAIGSIVHLRWMCCAWAGYGPSTFIRSSASRLPGRGEPPEGVFGSRACHCLCCR